MRQAVLAIFSILVLSCSSMAETITNPIIVMKTSYGEIELELNAEKAPVTVKNFLNYIEKKHFDGTVFHRIINGFMIQGGGFALEEKQLVQKDVEAGIINESNNGLANDIGTIAMARTSNPNSATAQFFINVSNNSMLNYPNNGGYAVFGKVKTGMEVVDQIRKVATTHKEITMKHNGQVIKQSAADVPVEPVVIESVTVKTAP